MKKNPFVELPGKVAAQGKKIEFLQLLTFTILFILFMGFGALLISVVAIANDSWLNKASTYQELTNTIREQNTRIHQMSQQIDSSCIGK